MLILGIDPGYATIGYGMVECKYAKFAPVRFGAITTPAGMEFPARLEMIWQDMTILLDRCKPDVLAIEKLFFTSNKTTAIDVAQARGVILLAAEEFGVPIYEYTPMQVKQAVAGYGGADKKQVMKMTQRLLHMKQIPRPDDAADALAIAICHGRAATSLLNREREFHPEQYQTR